MADPTTQTDRADPAAIVLARVFDAEPKAAFDLWSEPVRIRQWWHPKEFTTPEFTMDFRVGGSFRYCIRAKDHAVWAHGTYREISAPSRLVMTLQWESGDAARDVETTISVDFEPCDCGRTRLTLRHTGFTSAAERESHAQGWSQVLDAFAQALHDGGATA
jgi:uncharacterized protein YndB with AHSA1/START domain